MFTFRIHFCAAVLVGLVGCADETAVREQPDVTRMTRDAPDGADVGTCWSTATTPAIIETVTHQILQQPAEVQADGTILRPATYKTETRQEIVRERQETSFQTPCPPALTEEFIASLQRALAARGLFSGPVSGQMDARTRAAVRNFQSPEGIDSGTLSLKAARNLGLLVAEVPAEI